MDNFRAYNVLFIFIFFCFFLSLTGFIYCFCLNPKEKNIKKVINKHKVNEYCIPYFAAERYCIWKNMKIFFFCLDYMLTLLSIIASLMTVYFASDNNAKSNYIIFLALLSTCFTIASIFTSPDKKALLIQHVWRELDVCIIKTIYNNKLPTNKKDKIIIKKICELEKYIEEN